MVQTQVGPLNYMIGILYGMLEKGLNSPAFHAGIHGFESRTCHFLYGAVVQMVRMPACHAGGRGFDSHLRRIRLDSSVGRAED